MWWFNAGVHRELSPFPLGEAFEQPPRTASFRPEDLDGTVRVDAVGTATVRDILAILWPLAQPALEYRRPAPRSHRRYDPRHIRWQDAYRG